MQRVGEMVTKKIEDVLKQRGWTKKYFAEEILRKKPQWLNNKLKEHRKLNLEDLELIAQGLGMHISDLFPSKVGYDIAHMSIIDLIRFVFKKEFEKINNEVIKNRR